jgi:hypothetical protein
MSQKSVIAQTLVTIAKTFGCTIVDDVETANRVVCLYANDAISLMKQTEAMIDILVLPMNDESYNVAIEALATRFPERINVVHIIANDGAEGFPLLLESWIGGNA